MRFVTSKTLAGELRGQHIAECLGVPWGPEYQPDEWVVFVKSFDDIAKAKADGCMVALDPVDFYCYPFRDQTPRPEVDLVVIPSRRAMKSYVSLFPRADYIVIPHQWDHRIGGECRHDQFQPGYIGRHFNLNEELHIEMVTEPAEMLQAVTRFNCHVTQRESAAEKLLKPATKVATAAAVGAVVLTQRDPAAEHLLGEDYPFFAEGTLFDALYKARKAFGGEQWQQAREKMAEVKEKTSLQAIANLYRVLT